MLSEELNYCHARAVQERLAAQAAKCEVARKIHDTLAAMYQVRVTLLESIEDRAKKLT